MAVAKQANSQNTRKHFRDTENLEILEIQNLVARDQAEPVRVLVYISLARWRNVHYLAALHISICVSRKRATPKSNAERRQKPGGRPIDPMMRLTCFRSDCSRMEL